MAIGLLQLMIGVVLLVPARVGRKRLGAFELILLLAVALASGIFGAYTLGPLPGIVIELGIGLIWIGVRKGYLPKGWGAIPSAAAVPPPPRPGPALSSSPAVSRPSIFLSYRRGGSSDVTGRMYDRLVQHFGKESVFKDVDSIPLGVDFRKHLTDSVGQCQLLLAVIGKDWRGDESEGSLRLGDPRDFVRIEVESALQRGIPVIPVLVQGTPLPQEGELPASLQALAYHNAISVRPDPDFHSDMERLIKGIEHHLSRRSQQP